MKLKAPVKVRGGVGRRAEAPAGRGLSGEATTPTPGDHVDQQLSSLLESLEVELRESDLPRSARRAPSVSTSTSPSPLGREQAKATHDRGPSMVARALTTGRRTMAKARGLNPHWAHNRMRGTLLSDPVLRDRCIDITLGVMLGIAAAFVVIELLQYQALP